MIIVGTALATAIGYLLAFTSSWVSNGHHHPLQLAGSLPRIAHLPDLTALVGGRTVYIAYAAAGVVIFPIVWWMVPKTKERSLESLEAQFATVSDLVV